MSLVAKCPGDLVEGDYIFACSWSDADWNDPWVVGYVCELDNEHVIVGDRTGLLLAGQRGFRFYVKLSPDQGEAIISNYVRRERLPFDGGHVLAGILGVAIEEKPQSDE